MNLNHPPHSPNPLNKIKTKTFKENSGSNSHRGSCMNSCAKVCCSPGVDAGWTINSKACGNSSNFQRHLHVIWHANDADIKRHWSTTASMPRSKPTSMSSPAKWWNNVFKWLSEIGWDIKRVYFWITAINGFEAVRLTSDIIKFPTASKCCTSIHRWSK